MEHSFNVQVATEVGISAAVLLNNIAFWIAKNVANNTNFYDGEYWTYNSASAFTELFPYMTEKQIKDARKKLKDAGYIKVGNYNKSSYDKTSWYALTDKAKEALAVEIFDRTKKSHREDEKGTPIPYINTDTKTNNRGTANNRFTPPTVEDVDEYIKEKQFHFQANEFVDYYESKGWLVGKSKMKNWKAACRTFEANELKWHPELKDMPPTKNFTGEYGGHTYYEGERLD